MGVSSRMGGTGAPCRHTDRRCRGADLDVSGSPSRLRALESKGPTAARTCIPRLQGDVAARQRGDGGCCALHRQTLAGNGHIAAPSKAGPSMQVHRAFAICTGTRSALHRQAAACRFGVRTARSHREIPGSVADLELNGRRRASSGGSANDAKLRAGARDRRAHTRTTACRLTLS